MQGNKSESLRETRIFQYLTQNKEIFFSFTNLDNEFNLSDLHKCYMESGTDSKSRYKGGYMSICCPQTNDKYCLGECALYMCYRLIYHHNIQSIIHHIINIKPIRDDSLAYTENVIIFLLAVEHGEYSIINSILLNGLDINQTYQNNVHYVFKASMLEHAFDYNQSEEMTRFLISNGADINSEKCNILEHIQVHKNRNLDKNRNLEVIDYILGLDISEDKLLFFMDSCIKFQDINIAKKIINMGRVDVAKHSERYFSLSLISAKSAEFLIKNGATIDPSRALYLACKYQNLELVKYYLKIGYIPDQTTIDYIVHRSMLNFIEIFMKYSVDFSKVTNDPSDGKEYDKFIIELKKSNIDVYTYIKYLLINYREDTLALWGQ